MKFILLGLMTVALIACQNQTTETPVKQTEMVEAKGCSKDLKMCPDGQAVGRDINNQCEFFACPAPPEVSACPEDVKQCPDGSFVTRDPSNFCEFKACLDSSAKVDSSMNPDEKACNKDLKMCPDGHGVGRNPLKNCEFNSCESPAVIKGEPIMCTQDVKQCPDGSFVGRDSSKNCAFKPCPEESNLQQSLPSS